MCIDFRLKKMMIVEIVLVISDENRASPLGKGSIRKAQTGGCHSVSDGGCRRFLGLAKLPT